jgi:catechol 2,3-dioxygenase-like lactoylglutathione lyase family enzyme
MARGLLHHVSLEISDVVRAQFFYDRFLVPLGFKRFVAADAYLGYTDGGLTLWLLKSPKPRIHRHPPSGEEEVIAEHLAFRVPSAGAVREREQALAREEIYPLFAGEEHPEFRPGYFSATWVDPDGIALEIYAVPQGRARTARPRRRAARPRARPTRARRAGRRARAAR